MIIAIDFDGTCVKHAFPKIGESIGAEPVLRALVRNGHKLILWTMRSNITDPKRPADEPETTILDEPGDYLDLAIRWFDLNDIPLYAVQRNPTQYSWTSSPKCYAEMYIDDASLGIPLFRIKNERPFVNWLAITIELWLRGLIKPFDRDMIHLDIKENHKNIWLLNNKEACGHE